MRIQVPEDVKFILEKLNSAGYEAYAVGGCVRDSILGRIPDDWDITTSAKPEETKALFPKTIDTGIQHGTVTVMRNHVGYEVTTYRIDGEYEDSRHPKEVIFTADLLEDLKRRDFTINAMAYNHLIENDIETTKDKAQSGLVDAFGGIEDIENKIIRCVGNPIHRFEEDALRMMRAEDVVIVITSKYYVDIWKQLQDMEELSNNWGVIWPMIAPQYKTDNELKKKIKAASDSKNRIPKKIHYFWFGGNPIPELESRCIESWKKFCSDYEIIRWDENNYDIHQNKYMEQAYKAQKWGFVPDYARLDVVYQHGGIYLDTDVEIIRNFDELLELPGFMGFESKKYINMGQGFGALARNSVIKLLRDDYETKEFIVENNQFNLTPSPVLQTEVLLKHGLKLNNKFQRIQDMMILPAECFSPDNNMIPHVTENTFSIHHFSGSWTPENNKRFLEKQRRFISRK